MNAKEEIIKDIKRTINKGLKLNILVNPRTPISEDTVISSKFTFFKDEEDYCLRYHQAYEEEKYLFAMEDGSYFQIHYEFDVKSKYKSFIRKQNLCFLPGISEKTCKPIHCYLRLDYNAGESSSFFHPQAHLHIGLGNDLRIPVDNILRLSDFLELVFYLFYSEYLCKWNEQLKIGYSIFETKDSLSRYQILAEELKTFFYFHQKE